MTKTEWKKLRVHCKRYYADKHKAGTVCPVCWQTKLTKRVSHLCVNQRGLGIHTCSYEKCIWACSPGLPVI